MTTILAETRDRIAQVTLNRPEKLNAFAGTMREELVAVLREISTNGQIGAVIVTGAGRGFCAGGDVDTMAGYQREAATVPFQKLLDAGKEIVTLVREMPQIVIAAINGVAAGAGCNLALACDYRVASSSAKLGETFVRIGLHPDWGGTYFLPRLVGSSRALELMATGRMVDAEEAFRMGMVDRVVPDEQLMPEAEGLAMTIAAGPAMAIRALKQAVYASAANTLGQQVDLEGKNQLRAFLSRDAGEGMRAFFEKRKPSFE
jgi:enoyl-CoA hydratase/carnithine racemase